MFPETDAWHPSSWHPSSWAELLAKPKKGLGVPLTPWLGTILRDRMEEAIDKSRTAGWFRHRAIRALRDEHFAGRRDHRKALWSFLVSAPFQYR